MRFALTPEQDAFRSTARRFLAERVRVREQMIRPGAHDSALWREIAALGWLGIDVPESLGGQGLGLLDTAIVVEEAGRALLPGPFLGQVLAVQALLVAGSDEDRAGLIPDLVSGVRIAAVSLADPAGVPALRLVRTHVRGDVIVPCAEVADLIFVVAQTSGGPALVAVNAAESITEAVEPLDLTRHMSRERLDGAHVVARLDPARLGAWATRARALVAAEAVGGADRALEMAVAYAKDREQFGRPIGSFQAVKHRAADGLRALEAARYAARYAAWAIDNDLEDAPFAATAAKAAAGDACVRCAADSIQIHGGIGFTWEHDAHLYYRRALATQAALGDAAHHRDQIAAEVLSQT